MVRHAVFDSFKSYCQSSMIRTKNWLTFICNFQFDSNTVRFVAHSKCVASSWREEATVADATSTKLVTKYKSMEMHLLPTYRSSKEFDFDENLRLPFVFEVSGNVMAFML